MKSKVRKKELTSKIAPSPKILRIRKIVGQLQGVERMVQEERPRIQVLQQVQAAIAGLTSLKVEILKRHLNECAEEAKVSGNNARFINHALEIITIQFRK